jgi:DNA-directed RNA polymerase subunit RPC12/RpoP
MKRYPFVCTNCGAEYMLQAWKAVCPNCGAEFTLEAKPEKPLKSSAAPQIIGAAALFGYVVSSFFFPSVFSVFGQGLAPVAMGGMALLALLMLTGSYIFIGAALLLSLATLVYHFLWLSAEGLPGLFLAAATAAGSGIALSRIRLHGRRKAKEMDARAMPEYSGWGAPREDAEKP